MPPRGGDGRGAPPVVGEDAATRVTLNYALGNLGGRQKSWMTAGQPPPMGALSRPADAPRKRGRPRKHPQEQTQARQVPATEPVGEQPLSNSTSPQLANVVSHPPNAHPVASPSTVLPSPTPSEDASLDYYMLPSTTAAHRNGLRNVGNSTMGDSISTAGVSRQTSPEDRFLEGARQAVAVLKRPVTAEANPTLANKRTRPSIDAHGRPIPPPLRIQNANLDQHNVGRRVSGGQIHSPSPTVNQPFSPALRQQAHSQPSFQQQPMPQRIPSQPHVQVQNDPTSPPVPNPSSPSRQSPSRKQDAAANRLTTQTWPPALMDVREHCLHGILRFTTSNKVSQNASDSKRIKALEMAVLDQDWDYLMTHLFYCLLTLNKAVLPGYVRHNPHAPVTENFLSEVLDVNHSLMPAVQRFFVEFPMPLPQLLQRDPEQFKTDVDRFINLMNRSATYYTMKRNCDQRDFPPLMHEMVYDMGIRSKQLQRIVFTATIRRLWAKWGLGRGTNDLVQQFENEAMQFLITMQNSFYSRIQQGQQQGQDVQRDREAELQNWKVTFARWRKFYAAETQQTLQNLRATHQVSVGPGQHVYPDPRIPHSAQARVPHGRGRPRGRPRLATHEPRPQPQFQVQHFPQRQFQMQVQSQAQPSPRARSIFPPAGYYQPQQHQPNPARFGLHQAHLRSANLQTETRDRLYLYVQSFLREPQRLTDAGHKVERWCFTLTPEQIERIPKDLANGVGAPPVRIVNEKSFMLRLRCVKWNAENPPNEHNWAISDTSWIPYSYFTLNGKSLEQRKKLHYGKDLPIDLTSFVKKGENTLDIAIIRNPEDDRYRHHLLAIEILGVKPHEQLLKDILANNHVSAATTLKRIKDKLAPITSEDEDEIMFVNSSLTIKLFDPFAGSKMCDIPARSKACDHFDCFDLLTFLETRKRDGDSSLPDIWKCPICNGDARPQHLIVDGFLEEVREELKKQGLSNTRAIVISEDGSWKPKAEVLEGVADHDDDDTPANASVQQKTPLPQGVEVIDLGDSDDE